MIVVEKETQFSFGDQPYLGFERLTYAPIDKKLVDVGLMEASEIRWVDEYHDEVWNKLSPYVEDEEVRLWLWEATRPITVGAEV